MSDETIESLRLLDAWVDSVCEEIMSGSDGSLSLPSSWSDAQADAVIERLLD